MNSFAQLPASGGRVSKEIARQCCYRAPEAPFFEKGTNSGLWLAASDPAAALTAPSSGVVKRPVEAGARTAPERENAELLGKLFG